jgi:hypothetical protein
MDEKDVLRKFRRSKVLTIEQLVDFQQCSVITARRRLKHWKAYTSFNRNGRYYALPEAAQFDHNGIWKYQRILFSKHGNLKQTVIKLVVQSDSGLSARELAGIVELPSNSSFFSKLHHVPGIRREKHWGRFFYFSDDAAIYSKQKQACALRGEGGVVWLSDADAVMILVALIKHPGIGLEGLSDKVAQQGKVIEPSVIERFLGQHDLLKKIPDTKR